MAAMNMEQTADEAIQSLDSIATERGNTFRVKIMRQDTRGNQVPSITWAVFDGCTIEHLIEREMWLESLIGPDGGGFYIMNVYHTSELTKPLVALRHEKIGGTAQPPCVDVIKSPTWKGPRTLSYPSTKKSVDNNVTTLGGGLFDIGVPTIRGATQTVAQPATANATPLETEQYKRNVALAESLERKQRELEAAAHKAEVESRDRAWQLRLQEMQAANDLKFATLQAAMSKPVEKTPTIMDQLPSLAAALAPFVIPMLADWRQSNEKRDAEARATQDRMLSMQKESTTQLIEVMKTTRTDQSEMSKAQAEAMGAMIGVVTQTVHTLKELNQQEPENPWIGVLREVSPAIAAIGETWAKNQAQKPKPIVTAVRPVAAPKIIPAPRPSVAPQQTEDMLEETFNAIQHHFDINKVANYFLNGVQQRNASILVALKAHEGDPEKLVRARLGGWAMRDSANLEYLQKLMIVVEAEAQARGMSSPTTPSGTMPANGETHSAPAPTVSAQPADEKASNAVVEAEGEEEEDDAGESDDASGSPDEEDAEEEQQAEDNNPTDD